jgi:hypothetical protein
MSQKTQKNKKQIYFMCGDNESEDMVSDLNKMEYLINTKALLLFELE